VDYVHAAVAVVRLLGDLMVRAEAHSPINESGAEVAERTHPINERHANKTEQSQGQGQGQHDGPTLKEHRVHENRHVLLCNFA